MKEAAQQLIRNIKSLPPSSSTAAVCLPGEEEKTREEKPTKAKKRQLRGKSLSAPAAAAVCGLSEWGEVGEKHAQLSYERRRSLHYTNSGYTKVKYGKASK